MPPPLACCAAWVGSAAMPAANSASGARARQGPAQGQLVRRLTPTCREWAADKLAGLKTEAGILKQGEHCVAGRQLGLDDRLEAAEEPRLRIKAIAPGIVHDQASLRSQHAMEFPSGARSIGQMRQRHGHEDEVG